MLERTFHRGAVVSKPMTFKGVPILWDKAQCYDPSCELPGFLMAAFSKPFRQRRKGPIVRFGGRTS